MKRLLLIALLLGTPAAALANPVDVTIAVQDRQTGQDVPCRIHLKDAAGKPQRAPGLPFWFDHFVCPGTATLPLDAGAYTIEIERGPEFSRVTNSLQVKG